PHPRQDQRARNVRADAAGATVPVELRSTRGQNAARQLSEQRPEISDQSSCSRPATRIARFAPKPIERRTTSRQLLEHRPSAIRHFCMKRAFVLALTATASTLQAQQAPTATPTIPAKWDVSARRATAKDLTFET